MARRGFTDLVIRRPGPAAIMCALIALSLLGVFAWSLLDWESYRDFWTTYRSEIRARVMQIVAPLGAAAFGLGARHRFAEYLRARRRSRSET